MQAFLIGGTAVITVLGGLYLTMLRSKKRQEERGTNPYCNILSSRQVSFLLNNFYPLDEQILAHVPKHESRNPLPAKASQHNNIPPLPEEDGHSARSTIPDYKGTPEYAEYSPAARNMVPPQRDKTDDSGKAYPKSPDYAQNYEKTDRPDKVRKAES